MKRQLPNIDPKDVLPLGIDVVKGVIILGNSSTPNLLVAEFERTEGTFGILEVCFMICLLSFALIDPCAKSRSKLDLYRQVLALKFQHALIRYVRNEDYVDVMSTIGELVHGHIMQYDVSVAPRSVTVT